ncbi:MAG TPA: hypothetical protein VHB77_19815 [Planctomycetaceae bacterium]|jgi:hypothetical protein|nr:hypothetical protein [Planctomycetaceae bacterium]
MRGIVGVCVVGLLAAGIFGCSSNPLAKPKPMNNGCLSDRLGSYPLPGSPEVQSGTPEIPSYNIPQNMQKGGSGMPPGGGMPPSSNGFNDPNMYPK